MNCNKIRKLIFIAFLIILISFSSCKKKQEVEDTTETQEETETTEVFDAILDETAATTSESKTTDTEMQSEELPLEQDAEDDEETYADPSCGDGICTYYETYSSCPDDCEKLEEITLNDYPGFLENGTILVVGNSASSTDVITATLINTYLLTQGISAETKLSGEVSDYETTDLILIGNPCDNSVIANILHYTSKTCRVIITEQNNAVIKLLVQDKNEIIIITGYDAKDTKIASAMLTDTTTYNLNGAEEWINLANYEINLYFSKN